MLVNIIKNINDKFAKTNKEQDFKKLDFKKIFLNIFKLYLLAFTVNLFERIHESKNPLNADVTVL